MFCPKGIFIMPTMVETLMLTPDRAHTPLAATLGGQGEARVCVQGRIWEGGGGA